MRRSETKITDTQIAEAAAKFVDAPYALDDPACGWDCLNSILDFYRSLGVEPVARTEIDGWTEDNYADRWIDSEKEGRRILRQFLTSLGQAVDINFTRRGDLYLFESDEVPMFPGIYLGNDMILVNWGKGRGMRIAPLSMLRIPVVEVRRLI